MTGAEYGLDLPNIQAGVVRPRPPHYVACYLILEVLDAEAGRTLVERLIPYVPNAQDGAGSDKPMIGIGFTFAGLRALGVPEETLDSFEPQFQEGMAARAHILGDRGPSAPDQWESPFASGEAHIALMAMASSKEQLDAAMDAAQHLLDGLQKVRLIYRLDLQQLPTGRTHFGYRDGIGQPLIDGLGMEEFPGQGPAIRPGEFLFGYPNEMGGISVGPSPDEFGRNGSIIAFRKLHTDVAGFRRFLSEQSETPEQEELLAAKMVGRWRSGAPLVLCPQADDPELGADFQRNNDFRYLEQDPKGFACPMGSHMRRAYPRDSLEHERVAANIHRILRRGATYGPMLPEGVLEDDGAERGIVFILIGSNLHRQYEFIKTQWLQDGVFINATEEKDPLVGQTDDPQTFTIPDKPIRRKVTGIPRFVTTRGGLYAFAPGINGLRWIASLGKSPSTAL
ncbi:peroxidase [Mycolicibacterium sp.]|uniref:Dyp-type peroxidase n=1 Tax=Mycolicibacterium sp. TaxID=2320850 RepID=UPI0028A9F39A|nr:peroxidase [Mycolicibacterium sp.]